MNEDEMKKIVLEVLNSFKPCKDDPAFKYAEALLIVFNQFVESGVQAFKFDYKDLYELIMKEDAGRIYASNDLNNRIATETNSYAYKLLLEERSCIDIARNAKHQEVLEFMERVSDALTFTVFSEKYNRELVITEYEGDIWIAIDLKSIKISEISF